MNEKIKNYVDLLFEGVPRSAKAIELRNEILSNLNDKFEALRAEGKTENEAYGLAIAGLDNVDKLIKETLPDAETSQKINAERKRKGLLTSLAVALYILSPAALIMLTRNTDSNLAVSVLLAMIGIATAILIYSNMSTPVELAPYFKAGNSDYSDNKGYFFSSAKNFYWIVVLLIYFWVSFSLYCWHISWLIFIAAKAVWQGITLLVLYFDEQKGNNR